jgi:hypothetical protein
MPSFKWMRCVDDKTTYVGISLDSSLPKQPQRGTDRDKHEAQRRGENSEASQCIASILMDGKYAK